MIPDLPYPDEKSHISNGIPPTPPPSPTYIHCVDCGSNVAAAYTNDRCPVCEIQVLAKDPYEFEPLYKKPGDDTWHIPRHTCPNCTSRIRIPWPGPTGAKVCPICYVHAHPEIMEPPPTRRRAMSEGGISLDVERRRYDTAAEKAAEDRAKYIRKVRTHWHLVRLGDELAQDKIDGIHKLRRQTRGWM